MRGRSGRQWPHQLAGVDLAAVDALFLRGRRRFFFFLLVFLARVARGNQQQCECRYQEPGDPGAELRFRSHAHRVRHCPTPIIPL